MFKLILFWCVLMGLMVFTVCSYACNVQTYILEGRVITCVVCPETNVTTCN